MEIVSWNRIPPEILSVYDCKVVLDNDGISLKTDDIVMFYLFCQWFMSVVASKSISFMLIQIHHCKKVMYMYNLYCTLNRIHSILYNIHVIVYIVHCTVYSVHYNMYIVIISYAFYAFTEQIYIYKCKYSVMLSLHIYNKCVLHKLSTSGFIIGFPIVLIIYLYFITYNFKLYF